MIRRKLQKRGAVNENGVRLLASRHGGGISLVHLIKYSSALGILLIFLGVDFVVTFGRSTFPLWGVQTRQRTPQVEDQQVQKSSSSGFKGPSSCVQSLVENKHAIYANSSLSEPSLSFRILLHSPQKDKYITQKILQKGTYEPDMEAFIARALPLLNATSNPNPWAVDIGANVGFHSLHMAVRGANVLSFEPAPDTAELLKCSAGELKDVATAGLIRVIEAGASDVESEALLLRHPNSPGMTTFGGNNSGFPLKELKNSNGTAVGTVRLLRVENVLMEHGIPEGRSNRLRLLKVDAEGFELHAFRGLNLTRFPFQFLTFEFFPKMLRASGDDPVDLLLLIRYARYTCDYETHVATRATRDELNAWISGIKTHVNIFCQLM